MSTVVARMSILASREHTCVHPMVSLDKNKNEECHKLIDGLHVSLLCKSWLCVCVFVHFIDMCVCTYTHLRKQASSSLN